MTDCALEYTQDTFHQELHHTPKQVTPHLNHLWQSRRRQSQTQNSWLSPALRPGFQALSTRSSLRSEPRRITKLGSRARATQLCPKPEGSQLPKKKGRPPLYHGQRGSLYRDFLAGGEDTRRPQNTTTETGTEAPILPDFLSRSNLAGSYASSRRWGPPQGKEEWEGERAGAGGRGTAAAPFPVARRARSLQLQPLLPVAASSILVFFGASILVLPKCPDPKQEVSAMEPSGPNRR